MLYLLRHGELAMAGEKIFLGQGDPPLSARGEAQARWWADTLEGRGVSAVHASDLGRTMHTARILADRLKVKVIPEPAFREIDLGEWEGMPMAEVRRLRPLDWEARGRDIASFKTPGGESFQELQSRVLPALSDIGQRYRTEKRPPLIVTHAGVIRTILCHLLGVRLENLFRFAVSKASLHAIDVQDGHQTLLFANKTPDDMHPGGKAAARSTCHATSRDRN